MLETNLTGEGTTLGQIILFLSFLLSTWVQWRKDKQARKDAEAAADERKRLAKIAHDEALEREARIKKTAEEQHAKTRAQFEEQMARFKKRFNGLMEEDGHD